MSRWKKFALIATALCLFAALGYWLWSNWTYSSSWSRLQAFKTELDQSDPGWRLEEILAKRHASFPPGDENPRAITEQVVGLLPKIFNDWSSNPTGDTTYTEWLPEFELNRLPPTEYSDRASCVAYETREAIEKARSLRFLQKDGGWELVVPDDPWMTLLPTTQNVRVSANVLQLDSTISAIHGDANRAIESVQANLHAAKAVIGEPTLISELVRLAVLAVAIRNLERTLALTEPTQGLKELQAEFAAETRVPGYTLAMRGERAFGNRMFESIENGKIDLYTSLRSLSPRGLTTVPVVDRVFLWQYRGRIPADHLAYLKTLTQMIEITEKPIHEQKDAFSKLAIPDSRYIFSAMILPALEKFIIAELRVQTQMRCAVVAIGCERFRQKHQRWPTDLGELGTEFLPEGVPIDPYSGKPLLYKRYAGGAVVYGLGEDRKDNQGNISAAGLAGTDLGFRLWDADRRAMEPLPAKASLDDQ